MLAHLRSYGQHIFPKQETLARKLELGLRTINRYMGELKNAGVVEVTSRGPSSSLYRLNIQSAAAKIGVASAGVEKPANRVENSVENLRNGVACGVAFGVARPSHLLMRGLRSMYYQQLGSFVEGDDGFKNESKAKTRQPAAPPPRPASPIKIAAPAPKTKPKPPTSETGWETTFRGKVASVARAKAVGGGSS